MNIYSYVNVSHATLRDAHYRWARGLPMRDLEYYHQVVVHGEKRLRTVFQIFLFLKI